MSIYIIQLETLCFPKTPYTSEVGEAGAPQILQKRALERCSWPQCKRRGASERVCAGTCAIIEEDNSESTSPIESSDEAGDGKRGTVSIWLTASPSTGRVSSAAK